MNPVSPDTRRPASRWCWRASNWRRNTAGCSKIFRSLPTYSAATSPEVETPGLQWIISVNRRPIYPYLRLEQIVNPWGYGSFGVAIRLDENATVEFVVRNAGYAPPAGTAIKRIGGRIIGRFWYNPAYGDATPRACHIR